MINDPHIIEYPESKVILLDVIKNQLEYEKLPYEELVAIANETGLEVKEKAYIECSGAAKIRLHCDGHPTLIKRSAEGNLTRAEFDLRDWTGTYDYARITVIDKDGKYAWTNPIFIK